MISIVVHGLNSQATYNVNTGAKAAFRLELGKRLCRFHFLVDLRRVVDIDPSIVGCGSQKLALRTDSQRPVFACFFAWEQCQRSGLFND